MWLAVAGLLDACLEGVPQVRADVKHLMERENVFLPRGKRLIMNTRLVRRRKIRDNTEDPLRVIVFLARSRRSGSGRWRRAGGGISFLFLRRGLRRSRRLRPCP